MKARDIITEALSDDFNLFNEVRELVKKGVLNEKIIRLEDKVWHFYFISEKYNIEELNSHDEIKTGLDKLDESYKFRKDSAHEPNTGSSHVHVLFKNKELFAINKDGSAHHRSSREFELSKSLMRKLNKQFPDFTIKKVLENTNSGDISTLKLLYS